MIVTALIVTGLREYTAKSKQLSESAERLLTTRSEAEGRIAARRAELVSRIDKELSLGLSAITPDNSHLSQTEMKSLLDDVVRPLSYQLEREVAVEELPASMLPNPKIGWRAVLVNTINRDNPFHPVAAAAWPTLTTSAFVAANFGPIGFASGALFFVIFAALTWVARKLWRFVSARIPTVVRALLITIVFAIVTWAACLPLMIPANGQLLADNKMYFMIAFGEVVAWTVALLFTANRLLKETTLELTSTNEELKREVISLNSAVRHLQRGISRVLHGPVQQAIAASLHQLQSTPAAATNTRVLAQVRQRIDAALKLLSDADNRPPDLQQAFLDLTELWTDVCDIAIEVTDEDLDVIQLDDDAARAVHELVGELCANAMKHGQARQVIVSIRVDQDSQTIVIDARNDGKPLAPSPGPGLGTKLLNEMCLTWSRRQRGGLVVTELTLPITL